MWREVSFCVSDKRRLEVFGQGRWPHLVIHLHHSVLRCRHEITVICASTAWQKTSAAGRKVNTTPCSTYYEGQIVVDRGGRLTSSTFYCYWTWRHSDGLVYRCWNYDIFFAGWQAACAQWEFTAYPVVTCICEARVRLNSFRWSTAWRLHCGQTVRCIHANRPPNASIGSSKRVASAHQHGLLISPSEYTYVKETVLRWILIKQS